MRRVDRVLVTGAQGFLGRHVVASWIRADPSVTITGIGRSDAMPGHFSSRASWSGRVVRAPLPPDLADAIDDSRFCYESVDLRDYRATSSLLAEQRPDVIVHLAAALRNDEPSDLVDINVGVVAGLVHAIADLPGDPPLVVFGSSGAVYGDDPGRVLPLHESARCTPQEPYSVSKYAAEHLGRVLTREAGIPAVWARIFNPVGPGLDERHLPAMLARDLAAIGAGVTPPVLTIGTLETSRDFVDARDVAAAVRVLAQRARTERVYNVASGCEHTVRQLLDLGLELAGVHALTLERLPPRAVELDRVVADVGRLTDAGHVAQHDLRDAMERTLHWYGSAVAVAAVDISEPAPDRISIRVDEPRQTGYEVHVAPGALASVHEPIAALAGTASVAVLSDSNVADLYADPLVERLRATGTPTELVVVPAGEQSKTMVEFWSVIRSLYDNGIGRHGVLVNVGGGMVTDLGGYVAATYLRGIRYVNVPTSLLAQHDAAVGGKVAVNAPWAKNFVGGFHHPEAVYADPGVLATLDRRELCAGVVEALKVAMCIDPVLLDLIEAEVSAIRDERRADVLTEVVSRAVRGKSALLSPDPYEVDLRRPLNLGHTFGHALEVESDYELRHGEAVAVGLLVAAAIAVARGTCSADYAGRIGRVLGAYTAVPEVSEAVLLKACHRLDDIRLVRGGVLNFVLPVEPGRVEILTEVDQSEIVTAVATVAGGAGSASR